MDVNKEILYTQKTNIIVQDNNKVQDGVGFRAYKALSYVSSGSNKERLIFVIGEDTIHDKQILVARYSNDRIKYIAAMNTLKNDLLWTDYISLQRNYRTQREKMKAIGKAYSLSSATISILEKNDAALLQRLVDNIELSIRVFADDIVDYENLIKISFDDSKIERMIKNIIIIVEKVASLVDDFDNKSQYSYWSRIWTLQEQHMSNRIEYYRMNPSMNGIELIIDSDYMYKAASTLYSTIMATWKEMEDRKIKINSSHGRIIAHFLKSIWTMLAGKEKLDASLYTGKQIHSIDRILMEDLTHSVRCSSNRGEMCEAIAIALGIYIDAEEEMWKRIVNLFVSNGYVPVKQFYGVQRNSKLLTWEPEATFVAMQKDADSFQIAHYSVVFKQFVDGNTSPWFRSMLSEKNSLVLRTHLVELLVHSCTKKEGTATMVISEDIVAAQHDDRRLYDAHVSLSTCNTNLNAQCTLMCTMDVIEGMKLLGLIVGQYIMIINQDGDGSKGTVILEQDTNWKLVNALRTANINNYYVLKNELGLNSGSFY